jgi:hypothetical protein
MTSTMIEGALDTVIANAARRMNFQKPAGGEF